MGVRCWTEADGYRWRSDGDFAITHSGAESGCSGDKDLQVEEMSLNRCEQLFFDYLSQRAEERQYWQEKVRRIIGRDGLNHYTVTGLERELWAGFKERSQVVPRLREWVQSEGNVRISMQNLAEFLIRLWSPRAGKKAPALEKVKDHPI